MRGSLRAEQIYDALLDDDSLKQLPAAFVEAYGARSCTLHWRHNDGGAEILSHSDYFPQEQMLNYAENFTSADLWTLRASERANINRVWNGDDLVPQSTYGKSRFYNDWIRAMGDDTYFCLGTVMQTKWGQGIIGIHRGKTQSTFEPSEIRALTNDVVHLRRMLAIRGRLAAADRKAELSNEILNAFGGAVIAVSPAGRVLYTNAAAEGILNRGDGVQARNGVLVARAVSADRHLKEAIARASEPKSPKATAIAVPRAGGGKYDLCFTPARSAGAGRQILITASDPDSRDCTLQERLRQLYRLTPTEADLAVRITEGAAVGEVARERGVTLGTVQSQMKAVLAKLDCHRQAEVVRIVASLPKISSAMQS